MDEKSMSNKSNRVWQILFAVFVIGALFGGIFYIFQQTKDEETINQDEETVHEEEPEKKQKTLKNKRTFILNQLGHINSERDRLKVTFGPSSYYPTGLYVNEGDEIRITVNDHDQFNHPRLIISPPVLTKTEDAIEEGFRIEPGEKELPIFRDGILYLVNHSYETEQPPEVTIEGANVLPTFTLGETTLEEWKEILKEHTDAPAFELVSDRVVITAGMDEVDLVSDPEELLKKHDEAVEIQARVSGLEEDDPNPVHHPTKYRYHYRHSKDDGFWMYAWYNHTGYHTDALRSLLHVESFVTNGWGPWHELGHVHQQGATTPGIFGEVTNNVFSMTVQREFDQPSRLEEDQIYENAFKHIEEGVEPYEELDVWTLLVSLWQLDLAYGEDFYPQIYRMVRETDANELPNNDDDKIQRFVYWSSIAAEQNLIPFFEAWNLGVREDTREEIEQLGLETLKAPIWWNRDINNTILPKDVTIESILKTLEAYQEEMPRSIFESLEEDLDKVDDQADEESKREILENMLQSVDEFLAKEELAEKMHHILSSQIEILLESLS